MQHICCDCAEEICEIFCKAKNISVRSVRSVWQKKKEVNHEKAESDWAGGEGHSSRAHGFPHGDRYDELYGQRPVLKERASLARGVPFSPTLLIIYNMWLIVFGHMERSEEWPFALIYINKVTKRQIFDEKTDKMFVISDFWCNFATDFQEIILQTTENH